MSQKPTPSSLVNQAKQVLAPCYAQPDLIFVRGEGCHLFDSEGRDYLDMTSGIAVTALGHHSPIVEEAVAQAAKGLIHTSNLFYTEPAIALASELIETSFADQVFFCNSGTEANEAAIKFARLHGGEERRQVVFFSGSFHGRTFGSLAATAKEAIKTPFTPLPSGFEEAEWNQLAGLKTINHSTAAVIVEPIQGESGVRIPDQNWMLELRKRCDEVGALLIFDEVQVGVGRTGRLWAHELFDVKPDMMTLAKPLGGGLPIGAVLLSQKAASTIKPGCHGTTFGGGPFVTSVARKVLATINNDRFLHSVREKAKHLAKKLNSINSPLIREIRGRGLIWALELTTPVGETINACRQAGLLLVGAGENVVRFLPPLNIEISELDKAVSILEKILTNEKEMS